MILRNSVTDQRERVDFIIEKEQNSVAVTSAEYPRAQAT
jgi:hypothetical protein